VSENQKQSKIGEVSPTDGCEHECESLWWKRFMEIVKKICFSLERKSEGVVDDESGDGEEDENKED